MQNVVPSSKCDSLRDNDINDSIKDHSGSSSPLSGNICSETGPSLESLQSHFMAEPSDSEEDEECSEVDSFILDPDNDSDVDSSQATENFLLSSALKDSVLDSNQNQLKDPRFRLEALLEASSNLIESGQLDGPLPSSSASFSGDGRNEKKIETIFERRYSEKLRPSTFAEACSHGDISTVKKLLEGRNINEVTEDGESLLSLAASSGYYEMAQLLLAMKANVEDRGLKEMTPLMEAANAGNVDIVKLLIQHGADVNAQTSQEKKLKGAKVKNQELKTQPEIHGAIPSIVCPEGNTPLMFACAAGHEEIVKILLDAGARVEDHNENGHTPLMEAASAGHVGVAKLLVERGASINTHSNEFKESALTLACYKGHLEMVRFLLEAGADREHKTDEMHTALMEASMDGHVEVARLLLDSGAQVNMPADSFESPLTLAACGGHVELAMLLLDRGANIEEVNDEGYTPLMEAAREGHEEMVALLLSQGADINAQTEETQETALTLACCGGFLEVADFLIKAGADIELGASTPLMEAAQEGHLELVRYLISAGANVNATTTTGDTALTYACENGHTDVADLLLQAYAKLEHESEGGRTPLMKAARAGHLCTVQFLISKGANVNKQTTNNDHTPLSLACAGGHLSVVELLLNHGADPTHKLKDNSTMLIEASKGGHTAVVQMLLDYPNSVLSNPPPADLSQISNAGLDSNEAPRVPPHGLQGFHAQDPDTNSVSNNSYLANVQAVPRIQDLLRDSLPTSTPSMAVPKQKAAQRKSTAAKTNEAPSPSFCENIQRYHYRSGKSNAAAQANSLSIQTETQQGSALSGGGGSSSSFENAPDDDQEMKPSERLEKCINSMIKKAEMLHPSPEEQIQQKQQILEELQRVERELQEKAQTQLLLTAQHQQHHQNLHALGTIITGAAPAALPQQATAFAPNTQQLLINNGAVLDIESLSTLSDLSGSSMGLHFPPASNPGIAHTQQIIYQNRLKALQEQQQQQQAGVVTSTTLSSEYCKSRLGKSAKQSKANVMKQVPQQQQPQQQQQQQMPAFQLQQSSLDVKLEPPMLADGMEKLNLRNIVFDEQQQMQLQQQLLHQHTQQQFVLSEFTQNMTLRGTKEYCEGAIAGLMHAMGGIKLTTADSTQTPAIPMYDPVTVGQALLQQQQQHLVQHQQLTQVIQQESAKRQQQQPQNLQQHFEKNTKLLKAKPNKMQQPQQPMSQPPLASFQNPQAIKQFASTCGDTCTLVSNIPIDGSGVLTLSGMAAPTFPVSIAVTPGTLTSPVTIAGGCGSSFTHNLALDDGLMVAAPARTLHETLGEIMSGPTTQLAGTHMNLLPQPCSDACLAGGKPRALSAPTSLPMTFHTLHTPSPCSPQASAEPVTCLHPSAAAAAPPIYPPIDLNSQTDSNHDTALTLACAGGHEELVTLLLSRGADIEHRDKKGHSPLMLAASAGHVGVVEILLNNAADIEAPAERTKDTALSVACSGGRYEVVDLLLSRGANKEHRNVSDYTPLSLAASGGYVNIIKLLLSNVAEINSRTGSKLGISPLMLAAMNGHTQAVKLLLDMGSDINAQIETNRNTALTLACFQGRNEVVSLLLDRKANVEHRAKTGLTPLMEAASGGYVEVGKVLIDKGADVNAPPVPSSRDTALTIAADKGHYRFVQLLLERDAIVEVKNKKGNSPLWLAANGGHLEVVQLLYAHNADIDSQDNRKVSCLMAAFRKGHLKVVKWMVKHVNQFPSDSEMSRFMSTLSDKEMIKKCGQCADIIRIAKERQAAEANKNANILLEELDLERSREESRKAAAARRRERKRKKKREKAEQIRAAAAKAAEVQKCKESGKTTLKHDLAPVSDQSDVDEDDEEEEEEEEDEEEEDKEDDVNESNSRLPSTHNSPCKSKSAPAICSPLSVEAKSKEAKTPDPEEASSSNPNQKQNAGGEPQSRPDKRRERDKASNKTQEKGRRDMASGKPSSNPGEVAVVEKHLDSPSTVIIPSGVGGSSRNVKKRNQKHEAGTNCAPSPVSMSTKALASAPPPLYSAAVDLSKSQSVNHKHYKQKEVLVNGIADVPHEYSEIILMSQNSNNRLKRNSSGLPCDALSKMGLDSLSDIALDLPNDVSFPNSLRSPLASNIQHTLKSSLANTVSPKKWPKREEGWKEVVRSKLFNRSKKVSVPANAISRVIGRGGMNINAIREASGAHIEVEKQKSQGDRTVIIRGSAESTRIAQQLITALIKEPDKELSEILNRCGLSRIVNNSASFPENFRSSMSINPSLPTATQVSSLSGQSKNSMRQQVVTKSSGNTAVSVTKTNPIPPPSLPANATPPFSNQIRSVVSNTQSIRPGIAAGSTGTPPFLSNGQNAWTGVVASGKMPTNMPRPSLPTPNSSPLVCATTAAAKVSIANISDKISPRQFSSEKKTSPVQPGSTTSTKSTVSYTLAVISISKSPKTVSANLVSVATKLTTSSDTQVSTIAPISMDRAACASPSAVVHNQMAMGHNMGSGPSVQPFANSNNQSQKLTNGSVNTQHGSSAAVQARIHVTQAPSKPFLNAGVPTSAAMPPSSNHPSGSPPAGTLLVTSGQSTIPKEYSPFSNMFAKVTQSMWGQKEQAGKPNFASVAASGVTSVASHTPISNPVQSTLTLTLPQNAELADMVVDLAKAPGYRGNLHISPSPGPHFGAIGSGPRSAPCTPPLGPIGPPQRLSTPPAPAASQSPPPPHNSREPQELQRLQQQQQAHEVYHHLPPRSGGPALTSPTSTTYSQNAPLSSVLPESAAGVQVVQSNLNPNAPDFSSRASLLMPHAPAMHLRLPTFQESSQPHLAAQFRPIIAPNYPLHHLAQVNRFPFHHLANHQQPQQQPDFNGPMPDVESLAMLNMMPQNYHPTNILPNAGNMQHYPGMMGIRPNQRSSSTTPSVGTSSKDEGSPMAAMSPSASPQGSNLSSPTGMNVQENSNPAGTIGEDRKLPRPIGMERAQKKNPMFGGVSEGIWSFNSSGRSEIPVTQDWMQNVQNTMPSMQPPEDGGAIPALHNYTSNRFSDVMAMESNHNIDPTYQAIQNPGYSFMNGMPSHQIPPHLYLNNAAVGHGQVEPSQVEMWNMHQKVPLSSGGDTLPQNIEHKMQQWPNWSQHQA